MPLGAVGWGAVAASAVNTVGGALLTDDHGGGALNDASAWAARKEAELSERLYNYNEATFQPLEKSLVDKVSKLDTPEEQEAAAGRANADVTQSFDRANRNTAIRNAASGINPASPSIDSNAQTSNLTEAAQRATAMTLARKGVTDDALTKQFSVAQLGRGLPGAALSGLDSSARTLGTLGVNANNAERQQAYDIGYALKPLGNAISNGVNKWFGTSTPKSSGSFSPEMADAIGF